ncbi:hypothetical protein DSY14_04725 [Nocardiopsis sp. MG754419]|nr:hypothetical protein [Nocardiopsis sp. MG754419]
MGVLALAGAVVLVVHLGGLAFPGGESSGRSEAHQEVTPGPSPSEPPAENATREDLSELFHGGHDLALVGGKAVDFSEELASLTVGESPSDHHDRIADHVDFSLALELPRDPHVERLYDELSTLDRDVHGHGEIFALRVEGAGVVKVSVQTEARSDADPVPLGLIDVDLVEDDSGLWKVSSVNRFIH